MNKSRFLVFVALITVICFCAPAFAEDIYVKGKYARVRSGPGTNYTILWEAKKYSPFEFLAKYKKWYIIRDFEGDVGWVHEQVIGKGKGAMVIKAKANIRKGPGGKHEKLFVAPKQWLFKVLKVKGKWANVEDEDGDKGWVAVSLLWMSH